MIKTLARLRMEGTYLNIIKLYKEKMTRNASRDAEKEDSSFTVGQSANGCSHWRNQSGGSLKR